MDYQASKKLTNCILVFLLFFGHFADAHAQAKDKNDMHIFLKYIYAIRYIKNICPSPYNKKIQHKIQNAYKKLLVSAKQGNNQAQYLVGMANFYLLTDGDIDTAYRWFKKAAAQGNALAMRQLGLINFAGGIKIPQTPYTRVIALKWFEKAASLGDVQSEEVIGLIYLQGIAIQQNKAKYYAAVEQAAKSKKDFALAALGDLYYNGQGVEQNYKKAFTLYQQAIKGTTLPTVSTIRLYQILSNMYKNGLGTQKNLKLSLYFSKKAYYLAQQKKCFPQSN